MSVRLLAIPAVAATIAAGAVPASAAAAGGRGSSNQSTTMVVQTVPALPGVKVRMGGRTFVTGANGTIVVPSTLLAPRGGADAGGSGFRPGTSVGSVPRPHGGVARFDRFYNGDIAMADFYRFEPRFTGIGGVPLDPSQIDGYRLKSRMGTVIDVKGAGPVTLKSSRVVRYTRQLISKPIEWSVERVLVDATNVVQRARIRFVPYQLRGPLTIPLLFFRAHLTSRDALFRFPIGKEVVLTYPNGRERRVQLDANGSVTLPALPRGEYKVRAVAGGISPARPVALSRSQEVDLKVISWLDIGVGAGLVAAVAIVLPLLGRPRLRRVVLRRRSRRRGQPEVAQPEAQPGPAALVAQPDGGRLAATGRGDP